MVFRKAHDSQLIGIRAALRGGASWEQIAKAIGVPADFARKCFTEAIAERLDADADGRSRSLRPGRRAPRPLTVPTVPTRGPGAPPRRGPGPAAWTGAWYRKRNVNREHRRTGHVPLGRRPVRPAR